jgi:hypothetical protein
MFPDHESADAVTLWIATTHAQPAIHHATRLVVTSPQKRCGKSRLLDVIGATAHRPLMTVNTSAAVLFRSIEADDPPTIIVDEADTIFGRRSKVDGAEDLRGLFNAGFDRNRPVRRCVGPRQVPTEFPTFAMVALAGIGNVIPDTIKDRAVNIILHRRGPGEIVQPFRLRRDRPILMELHDQLQAWAAAHVAELRDAEPELPVEDRAADLWEPLVAVADVVGGDWPERARAAAQRFTADANNTVTESDMNLLLLSDIRDAFGACHQLSSARLVNWLRELPESPWDRFDLNQHDLARRVNTWGIRPDRVSIDGEQVRGYKRGWFEDAWRRYLGEHARDGDDAPFDEADHTEGVGDAQDAQDAFAGEEGTVESFLAVCCVDDDGEAVDTRDMYREFVAWVDASELELLTRDEFTEGMKEAGYLRRNRCWQRIALRDDE